MECVSFLRTNALWALSRLVHVTFLEIVALHVAAVASGTTIRAVWKRILVQPQVLSPKTDLTFAVAALVCVSFGDARFVVAQVRAALSTQSSALAVFFALWSAYRNLRIGWAVGAKRWRNTQNDQNNKNMKKFHREMLDRQTLVRDWSLRRKIAHFMNLSLNSIERWKQLDSMWDVFVRNKFKLELCSEVTCKRWIYESRCFSACIVKRQAKYSILKYRRINTPQFNVFCDRRRSASRKQVSSKSLARSTAKQMTRDWRVVGNCAFDVKLFRFSKCFANAIKVN